MENLVEAGALDRIKSYERNIVQIHVDFGAHTSAVFRIRIQLDSDFCGPRILSTEHAQQDSASLGYFWTIYPFYKVKTEVFIDKKTESTLVRSREKVE